MPYDGVWVLPGSPLARLLEADRKLTAERRAKAKRRRRPLTPWEVQERRVAQARASVIALDQLLELFADGKNWVQNAYHDDHGRHCLVGGLEHVRARQGVGDKAGVYLSRAIAYVCDEREKMTDVNDSRKDSAEFRDVILLARDLAQRVIVHQGA